MWIITTNAGLINADHVFRFTENSCGTHAYSYGGVYRLSEDYVMDVIIEALRNGTEFLEVK